jgi:hypothetical protein
MSTPTPPPTPIISLVRNGNVLQVKFKSQDLSLSFDLKNPTKVADKLKVYLKDAGATKEDILEGLSQLSRLYAEPIESSPEAAPSSPAYNFGKIKATPLLDKPLEPLHPAIGLTQSFAYIGALLPSLVTAEDEQGNTKTFVKDLPFIVTSDRKLIPMTPEALQPFGFRLAYIPTIIRGKWSEPGIKSFLAGQSCDPAKTYCTIRGLFKKYIEIESRYYDFLTLWATGTYFFHLFTSYPYMCLMGVKKSGKTKLLDIVGVIGFNAVHSSNMSASTLFRLVQGGRCTLLIDETEQLKNPERLQDFRSMLLAGYKKGTLVYRSEKTTMDKFEPIGYEIFAPKIMANITGLENVLEDRCITIIMKRGLDKAIINTEVIELDPVWQQLRDELHTLYLERAGELKALQEEIEKTPFLEGINARDRELWKPLYILAKFFEKFSVVSVVSEGSVDANHIEEKNFYHEKNIPPVQFASTLSSLSSLTTLIEALAKENIREKEAEDRTEAADSLLIQTLQVLVDGEGYYSVKDIKAKFVTFFEDSESWITNRWIGRALKRLGFRDHHRVGSGVEYYLTPERVENMAKRLGVSRKDNDEHNENKKTKPSSPLKPGMMTSYPDPPRLKTSVEPKPETAKPSSSSSSWPSCPRCGQIFANERALESHFATNPLHQEGPQ